MKKTFFYALLAIAPFTTQAQLVFSGHFPGSGYGGVYELQTTANGDVVTVGGFSGVIDIDPGSTTNNVTGDADGSIWIARYSVTGALKWGYAIDGTGIQNANDVDVDEHGNIYVYGTFQNTVDFDASSAVHNMTSTGDFDAYVLKLDSAGQYIWARSISGTGRQLAYDIRCNKNAGFYISGVFKDPTNVHLNGGSYILNSTDASFIAKYDLNGNPQWVNQLSTTPRISLSKTNGNESVYLATYCKLGYLDSVDVDPSAGFRGLVNTSSSATDVLNSLIVACYNGNTGSIKWAGFEQARGQARQGFDIEVGDIETDNNGQPVVAGVFEKSFATAGGNQMTLSRTGNLWNDAFVVKFDTNGKMLWERKIGTNNQLDWANDIMIDSLNNVWVTGHFVNTCEFDFTSTSRTLTSVGGQDGFVAVYSANNTFLWYGGIQGTENQAGGKLAYRNGKIYHAGHLFGSADCDITTGTSTLTSAGSSDGFLTIYNTPTALTLGVLHTTAANAQYVVYPNPATDILTIKTDNHINANIIITDAVGKTVLTEALNAPATDVDVRSMQTGIYYYKITDGNNIIKTGRITKL